MLPIKHKSIFKSRWVALLWAGGILYMAWDFANQVKTPDGNEVSSPDDFTVNDAKAVEDAVKGL